MSEPPHVLVVGGGLAGLVAARHLAGAGARVDVVERRDSVGGRVRTVERDGFLFDRGFQVLFTAYPAVRAELDLAALDLNRFAPGAVLARPSGRTILSDPLRDPRGLPATLCNRDVTTADKLRVLRLRVELARTDPATIFGGDDTTIRTFLRERGFSDRFLERFARPFYGGITLDRSLSTSSHVFAYTFRALSRGAIAVPSAGMGAIPRQLAARAIDAGATVECGTRVTSVAASGDGAELEIDGETRSADAIVVATDPRTASDLTDVDGIPTQGSGCVTQYYSLPGGDGLGVGPRLVLNSAAGDGAGLDRPPSGTPNDDDGAPGSGSERGSGSVGWPNQVVPHTAVAPSYAPGETSLIGATFLGERALAADASALETATREALAAWYPERAFDRLERRYTERIPFAQFAQPPGVHDDLPGPRAPEGPVYLAGDYTRWSSIQGAMESGRRVARAIVEDLA